jgi:hypothetical protein
MVLLLEKSFYLMIQSSLDAGRFSIVESILCELMEELVILFMFSCADLFSFVFFPKKPLTLADPPG